MAWLAALPAALSLVSPMDASAASDDAPGLAEVPFEQLLGTEVLTADKIARQISGASSAVSVVTAQDIRDFGYRTLGDILNSMRGLNLVRGQVYGDLAGRGYAAMGLDAGSITLLIDGYRAPDNVWGRSFYGNDGIVDVELIERVEYIPGSGSSSYGDSAFLGVINIVTKRGRDFGGVAVSSEVGSHGTQRARATYGKQFDNGVDLLLSASGMQSDGRYQLPENQYLFGTKHSEEENNQRYFLKATYRGWTFETGMAERSLYVTDGYIPGRRSDENRFASLKYDTDLSADLKASSHLYSGHYRLQQYNSNGQKWAEGGGDWWGIDSKLVGTWFEHHTLVFGAEYRNDFIQKYWNQPWPGFSPPEERAERETFSLYAYDDIALTDKLGLTLGARGDQRENGKSTLSPRTALVYSPWLGTTLKYSGGIANRQPIGFADLNRGGSTEVRRLYSNELVWEQMLGPKTRWINSLYRYRISDISFWSSSVQPVNAKGFETELEHLWANGVRLRMSYVSQQAEVANDSMTMGNLAKNIAKLNLSTPLAGDWLRAGLELRYVGPRVKPNYGIFAKTYSPETLIGDLTLTAKWNHWFATAAVRNVGNVSYYEGEFSSYGADRRNYWLQVGYEFN
jgi:iron complex outermembrane receptor protein